MIKGIGIDVVETARFRGLHLDEGFIRQVLTSGERQRAGRSKNPAGFVATHFAVKEALFKALGDGLTAGWFWHDIELAEREEVHLSGHTEAAAHALAVSSIHYTHSMTMRYTVALVVLEG